MKIINETGTTSVVFRLDKVAKFTAPSYIFETIKSKTANQKIDFYG